MAIVNNPISLPFSNLVSSQAEIGSITTLLAYHRSRVGSQVSSRVSSLVDGTIFQNVEFGSGVTNSVTLDIAPEKNWSRASSITEVVDAPVGQETLFIDQFKIIQLSINDIMAKQTGVTSNQIEALLSSIMQTLQNSHSHRQFERVVDLYKNWIPRAEQIVKVKMIDTTGLTGVELNQQNEANMRAIYKTMNETVEDMLVLTNSYTDTVSYTDGGVDKPIKRSLAEDNTRLVLNSKYNTLMKADGLAPIFNMTTLDSLKAGKRLDIIAQLKLETNPLAKLNLSPVDGDTIGWLHEDGKFALITFYMLTRSFVDASNLFTNYFLHYAFGLGIFKLLMGVKFVAEVN